MISHFPHPEISFPFFELNPRPGFAARQLPAPLARHTQRITTFMMDVGRLALESGPLAF
jgi:hypothetical protein